MRSARTVEGSYNLNVRIADLNQDGVPDFVDSYNWGTINFRINAGSGVRPRLPAAGTFSVTGPAFAQLDLHALTDGPIVDFADFNGDGTIDLLIGGEKSGSVRLALGRERPFLPARNRCADRGASPRLGAVSRRSRERQRKKPDADAAGRAVRLRHYVCHAFAETGNRAGAARTDRGAPAVPPTADARPPAAARHAVAGGAGVAHHADGRL